MYHLYYISMVLCKRGVVDKLGTNRKFDIWQTICSGPHLYLDSMSVNYILIIIYTLKNSTFIFAKILILQNKRISLCPTKYWMIYGKMSCKIDAHSFLLVECANIKLGMICQKEAHLYSTWILLYSPLPFETRRLFCWLCYAKRGRGGGGNPIFVWGLQWMWM